MFEILHKTIKQVNPKFIDTPKLGSWVVLEEPTAEEVDRVIDMLGLEPDLMKDAQDPYEVPRIEKEGDATYIFLRIPYDLPESDTVITYPALIVITEKVMVTLFQKRTVFMEKIRLGSVEYATTQKAKLLFQIISEINNIYSKFIVSINKGVRMATVDFHNISNNDIVNFLKFESTLNDFMSALVPTNALLEQLLKGKYITLFEDDKDLIEDNLLANRQLIEASKSNLKNIFNIRDAYTTVMTNNLNRVIRVLTVITIVLTIPTMISSFFGMNVPVPFEGSPYAFISIILIIIGISSLVLYIFSRKKWL